MSHFWGDDWLYWDKLYKAINLFTKLIIVFRGPVFLTKEKYGNMRLEYFYGKTTVDAWLFRKNLVIYHHLRLRKVSAVIDWVLEKVYINKLIWKYQVLVFNLVTVYVVKRYPEVKDEIMHELEFGDLLYNWVKKKVNYVCNWV